MPHDQFIGAQFLPGHSHSEGLVRIEYLDGKNTRSVLILPLLEAMLLLQQLKTIQKDAGIEFPTAR